MLSVLAHPFYSLMGGNTIANYQQNDAINCVLLKVGLLAL